MHRSAHALDREYFELTHLRARGRVPVPEPYAYCDDALVLGSEFYLMEYVYGRIFVNPSLLGASSPREHRAVYANAI